MDVPFDLYEGEGSTTRYTVSGPRTESSFCGNFAVLERTITHNEIANWRIVDAAEHALESRMLVFAKEGYALPAAGPAEPSSNSARPDDARQDPAPS